MPCGFRRFEPGVHLNRWVRHWAVGPERTPIPVGKGLVLQYAIRSCRGTRNLPIPCAALDSIWLAPEYRNVFPMNDLEPQAAKAPAERGLGSDFRTTCWSLVLEASRSADGDGLAALEELCRRYWFPLYAFVRKRGRNHADAQDLVQGFFAQLLARNDLTTVHPEKGRFRTFLLTALTHYAANNWRRTQAGKRGGSIAFEPLVSESDLDERYREEAPCDASAETVFDRTWAEQLLGGVVDRLRNESAEAGERERFDALQECLLGELDGVPYRELGARLGLSEAGVKSAVHRLRRRFRELFREEIGRTVARREDIDGELRYLVEVMLR